MFSSPLAALTAIAVTAAVIPLAAAFGGPILTGTARVTSSALHATTPTPSVSSSRRAFISSSVAAAASVTSAAIRIPAANAAETKESLVSTLKDSLGRIEAIPSLVESAEWDKIRTVLKTPPVNELWNLGESKNTLVRLAKETGDFEIMEIKDELAISLQMTDQYSYDNVFIYYQPGNGKVKTKEPLEMANKAISQLTEALEVVSSS